MKPDAVLNPATSTFTDCVVLRIFKLTFVDCKIPKGENNARIMSLKKLVIKKIADAIFKINSI